MARVLETIAQCRFTVEEYHRMADTGILSPDERVELVRGVIHQMSPKNRAHVVAANLVSGLFRDALRGRASAYKEDPLRMEGLDSEPEPDVMVCSNRHRCVRHRTDEARADHRGRRVIPAIRLE